MRRSFRSLLRAAVRARSSSSIRTSVDRTGRGGDAPAMRLYGVLGTLGMGMAIAPAASAQGAFAFLRLDPSPRAAALAGALDAVPTDDPASLFVNPALVSSDAAGVGLTYVNHLDAFKAGSLAYARQAFGRDWAVGVRYFGYGEMDETNAAGETTGKFGASSLAFSLATAQEVMPRLRAGVAVSALTTGIADARATALAADIGLTYTAPGALIVAATVRNAGAVVSSLGATDDELPVDVRLSVSKRLRYLPLLVTATGYDLTDGGGPAGRTSFEQAIAHIGIGVELQPGDALRLRVGFSPRRNQELATRERLDLAGLGLGASLRVRGVTVDYGFASWSENGSLHHVGVRRRM